MYGKAILRDVQTFYIFPSSGTDGGKCREFSSGVLSGKFLVCEAEKLLLIASIDWCDRCD